MPWTHTTPVSKIISFSFPSITDIFLSEYSEEKGHISTVFASGIRVLKGFPKWGTGWALITTSFPSALLVSLQILFFNGKSSDVGAVIGSTLFSLTPTASSKISVRQGLVWNSYCSSHFFCDLKSWTLSSISKSKSRWGCGFTGGFLDKIGPL